MTATREMGDGLNFALSGGSRSHRNPDGKKTKKTEWETGDGCFLPTKISLKADVMCCFTLPINQINAKAMKISQSRRPTEKFSGWLYLSRLFLSGRFCKKWSVSQWDMGDLSKITPSPSGRWEILTPPPHKNLRTYKNVD